MTREKFLHDRNDKISSCIFDLGLVKSEGAKPTDKGSWLYICHIHSGFMCKLNM
jgi:hypothetical protein